MIHLVWTPKYKKRVLDGLLAARIHMLLSLCAEVNGWEIARLNVHPDHVHIEMRLDPEISIENMVQRFKRKSEKNIRQEFPGLKEFLWGNSFWSDGYFAATAVCFSKDMILEYIQEQQENGDHSDVAVMNNEVVKE